MSIEWTPITIKLGDLKPWDENPRQSTPAQAKRILQSMSDFGQVQTIAVSPELDVYDGHQRLSALLTVHGADYRIDARQSSRHLTDFERRGLVMALHASAEGSWDWGKLANWDLPTLLPDGFAQEWLAGLNYDGAMVATLLEAEGEEATGEEGDAEPQIDKAAELQEKWATELGQLWQIGEHRLLIGDCTVAENVARLMAGEKADMVFTDPPYGINYDSNMPGSEWASKIENDNNTKIANSWLAVELPIKSGSGVFVCSRWDVLSEWILALKEIKLNPKNVIVWVKSLQGMGDLVGSFGSRWEAVIFAHDGLFRLPSKRIDDVWDIGHIFTRGYRHHPTEKPVGLPAMAIEHASTEKTIVYDPFLGSGSTMVACQNTKRKCYGMELSPSYSAVILERMITAFPDLDIYQVE